MTPGARVAAAIEILDAIRGGEPVEKALTSWARRSRFAGSKDRAAVRDHVFDVMRHWRSDAIRGGADTGRGRMIGRLRAGAVDLETLFHGQGHAPSPLTEGERAAGGAAVEKGDKWDLPDWILGEFEASLGEAAAQTAQFLQSRAPVSLRVNRMQATVAQATAALAQEGIEVCANPVSEMALSVVSGARKLRNSAPYLQGWVELQDASSQAVVAALPEGAHVLDYCAGGGGKSLAMAAQGRSVIAHDIDSNRMRDLPARARRAGVRIAVKSTKEAVKAGPYDLVLVDAPCSGSGAWRRSPGGKWLLTQERLDALTALQDRILDETESLVRAGGTLVFVTCSLLRCENEARVARFLKDHPDWQCTQQNRFCVNAHADGFFSAHLQRR